VEFEARPSDVEEVSVGEPEAVVLVNARRKAEAAERGPDDVVLGADTEVVVDAAVVGKAADEHEARRRLKLLSGRTHDVLSGVVLLGPGERERSGIASSRVTFRRLSEADLDLYVASGEWRDRAGAYAIQGLGSVLIERLEGDFSNVVGLPVPLLLQLAPEIVALSD
jgi:septum formation protein